MSTPPSTLPNKYVMPQRVADVEKLAANCDTAIRELTARFDRQPPRGERRRNWTRWSFNQGLTQVAMEKTVKTASGTQVVTE